MISVVFRVKVQYMRPVPLLVILLFWSLVRGYWYINSLKTLDEKDKKTFWETIAGRGTDITFLPQAVMLGTTIHGRFSWLTVTFGITIGKSKTICTSFSGYWVVFGTGISSLLRQSAFVFEKFLSSNLSPFYLDLFSARCRYMYTILGHLGWNVFPGFT